MRILNGMNLFETQKLQGVFLCADRIKMCLNTHKRKVVVRFKIFCL
jgi:hypothetical protein